jgi:hypothetical protein
MDFEDDAPLGQEGVSMLHGLTELRSGGASDLRYIRRHMAHPCHTSTGPSSAMSSSIDATELTTFDVDPGGRYVQLHMRDAQGEPRALSIPTDDLMKLLMTLPEMLRRALRNRHHDDSLRLVHALDDFKVELGQPDGAGRQRYILTLATLGGFEVSFCATQESLDSLSGAIAGDALEHEAQPHHSQRFS